MSGTSLDGVDVAALATDGERQVSAGPAVTVPYSGKFRERLRGILGGNAPAAEITAVEEESTRLHAAAVAELRRQHPAVAVDLVGFHGHTILHRPQERRTWQIGDGALLARLLGVDVVGDFRSADVAAGGEGAPLAPLYHAALAAGRAKPLAILNLGGVGNVTWVGPGIGPGIGDGEDDILAFDTGPGNALLDDWVRRHTGQAADFDGRLALAGRVSTAHVARLLEHPYFVRRPPKSLDRDDFRDCMPDRLAVADGAATLTEMTAAAVAAAIRHFPAPPREWLVCGGGRHNPALMAALSRRLGMPMRPDPHPDPPPLVGEGRAGAGHPLSHPPPQAGEGRVGVRPVEDAGWDGDALEAQAFAYLAVRSLRGLPLSLPTTTGAPRPLSGGRLFPAA